MSTLKVWCETCEGSGVLADMNDCPRCQDGYIAREVVELPDGRAVVVTRDVLSKAGVRACDEFNLACDDFHEGISDKLDAWDRSVAAALTALFTGGVYEAEAVGRLTLLPGDEPTMVLMPDGQPEEAGTAPIVEDGDRVAVLETQK